VLDSCTLAAQREIVMTYHLSRQVPGPFEAAVDRVVAALKTEGFGVLCDIDVAATMKQKIGVDFRNYRILGACNPHLAFKALSAEDKIGVMLPCNVIVQDKPGGGVEIASIDPGIAMEQIGNPDLTAVANEVRQRLQRVIDSI
jgi:uncharacterized protein (DUF302 family)